MTRSTVVCLVALAVLAGCLGGTDPSGGPDGRTHVAFASTVDWPLSSGKAMHAVERG